jgi:Uma2 family endonuclease
MISQALSTAPSEIIYPESDGKPMADNTKQFRWIVDIQQNINWMYINDANVFVAGDLFWYPVENRNKIVTAPDIMVVFGRPKGDRGSYKQWEENNIPPQVVFEILSPGNTATEMEKKLLFYDRYGVQEYYIYDPDRNTLHGWMRKEEGLDAVEDMANWVSPLLGIRFDMSGEELEIYRPDGTKFFSYAEVNNRLEQERQRAEQERQRAEQERQRAEQERQRAEQAQEELELQKMRSQNIEDLLQKYRKQFGELSE